MKKIHLSILTCAIAALAFTSCTKTGATGPAGATGATGGTGPNLSGNLEGYVDLFDSYGTLVTPSNGVLISIPGKTTAADTTNVTGMYNVANLTTGTYAVDLTKTGYGAAKVVSLNFVGGGTQYVQNHLQMTQAPAFTLSAVTLTNVGGIITASVTASSTDTKTRKVILFMSSASTVSSAPANYTGWQTINIAAGASGAAATISATTMNSFGIVTGNTLYVSTYPISVSNNASVYADVATGRSVFNNIGSASVTANILVP